MNSDFRIAGRPIGPDHPPYVIAEISANHCQNLGTARRIIEECAGSGVEAIKLQTYTAETMTVDADLPHLRISKGPWAGETLFELYRRAETPWQWTKPLKELAEAHGMTLFSSPFDATAVDFLESCDVPAYKVASFELTDTPLLRYIARLGKPVIFSTGLGTSEEILRAIDVLRENGCTQIAILKCTSAYPAPLEDLKLSLIPRMIADFGVPVGFSDHTLGSEAAVAAVALGACILEKHVQTEDSAASPDAAFSHVASDMKDYVDAAQRAFRMRGACEYGPTEGEKESLIFRRSVMLVRDVPAGAALQREDLAVRRPAGGIEPDRLESVIGLRVERDLMRGELLVDSMLAGSAATS